MKLLVKSPVWDDLREIGMRIAEQNPDAADHFLTAAEQSFEILKRHPRIGRLRSFSVAGVRSWVIPDFQNYLIFYLPTVRTPARVSIVPLCGLLGAIGQ